NEGEQNRRSQGRSPCGRSACRDSGGSCPGSCCCCGGPGGGRSAQAEAPHHPQDHGDQGGRHQGDQNRQGGNHQGRCGQGGRACAGGFRCRPQGGGKRRSPCGACHNGARPAGRQRGRS